MGEWSPFYKERNFKNHPTRVSKKLTMIEVQLVKLPFIRDVSYKLAILK